MSLENCVSGPYRLSLLDGCCAAPGRARSVELVHRCRMAEKSRIVRRGLRGWVSLARPPCMLGGALLLFACDHAGENSAQLGVQPVNSGVGAPDGALLVPTGDGGFAQ